MYMIPERTKAQKAYWRAFHTEKYRQEERQSRMRALARVTIRKDADGYRIVSYKDRFICCLFDNDKLENERMIRIIVNLLEVIE